MWIRIRIEIQFLIEVGFSVLMTKNLQLKKFNFCIKKLQFIIYLRAAKKDVVLTMVHEKRTSNFSNKNMKFLHFFSIFVYPFSWIWIQIHFSIAYFRIQPIKSNSDPEHWGGHHDCVSWQGDGDGAKSSDSKKLKLVCLVTVMAIIVLIGSQFLLLIIILLSMFLIIHYLS